MALNLNHLTSLNTEVIILRTSLVDLDHEIVKHQNAIIDIESKKRHINKVIMEKVREADSLARAFEERLQKHAKIDYTNSGLVIADEQPGGQDSSNNVSQATPTQCTIPQ